MDKVISKVNQKEQSYDLLKKICSAIIDKNYSKAEYYLNKINSLPYFHIDSLHTLKAYVKFLQKKYKDMFEHIKKTEDKHWNINLIYKMFEMIEGISKTSNNKKYPISQLFLTEKDKVYTVRSVDNFHPESSKQTGIRQNLIIETKNELINYYLLTQAQIIDYLEMSREFNKVSKDEFLSDKDRDHIDKEKLAIFSLMQEITTIEELESFDINPVVQYLYHPIFYMKKFDINEGKTKGEVINSSVNKSKIGSNLLQKIALTGNFELIKKININDFGIHFVDGVRRTVFHYAALGGNIEIINYLLSLVDNNESLKNDLLNKRDHNRITPLMFCLMLKSENQIKIAKKLIENGADVSALDNLGFSVLDYAVCLSENHALIDYIIKKGGKFGKETTGQFNTLIIFAFYYTRGMINKSIMKKRLSLILNIIPDLEQYKKLYSTFNGGTDLHQWCLIGNYNKILSDDLQYINKQDINKQDNNGNTPLINLFTPYKDKTFDDDNLVKIIKLYSEKGADFNQTNHVGVSPLTMIIKEERLHRIFDFMVKNKSRLKLKLDYINIKNDLNNESYLHVAIKEKKAKIIEYFSKSADFFKYNYIMQNGVSIINYALKFYPEALNILCSSEKKLFYTNAEDIILGVKNILSSVLNHGLVNAEKAKKLGIKQYQSVDKEDLNFIYFNWVDSTNISKIFSKPDNGFLSVLVERKKESLLFYKSEGASKTDTFILTRRVFSGFCIVTCAKTINNAYPNLKNKIKRTNSAEEDYTLDCIEPKAIDFIIVPQYMKYHKEDLKKSFNNLVILDDCSSLKKYDANKLYLTFAEKNAVSTITGKFGYSEFEPFRSVKNEVVHPDYINNKFLQDYLSTNKEIIIHMVRCDASQIKELILNKPLSNESLKNERQTKVENSNSLNLGL